MKKTDVPPPNEMPISRDSDGNVIFEEMDKVKVTSTQKVKVEEGDILLVTVPQAHKKDKFRCFGNNSPNRFMRWLGVIRWWL